jgi:hypothetical protein
MISHRVAGFLRNRFRADPEGGGAAECVSGCGGAVWSFGSCVAGGFGETSTSVRCAMVIFL